MFGSNPFVSSFSQPQNATGQNTWSSGPQNSFGGQSWGGYQPWGTNPNQQNSYGTSSSSGSVGASGGTPPGGYSNGGPYGGWNPTQSQDAPGYRSTVNYYNPQGQSGGGSPYYSPYAYGQGPQTGGGGSYTTKGWMPQGAGPQMPPWLSSNGGIMGGGMAGGMGVGYGMGGMGGMGGNNLGGSRAMGNPGAVGGGYGGGWGPGGLPAPDPRFRPGQEGPPPKPIGTTDPTSNTYGMESVGGPPPNPASQNQPYQYQNQGMVYNPRNTNNPSSYFPAPQTPSFLPDITARMLYGDKGYNGTNGMYINPDGTWSI